TLTAIGVYGVLSYSVSCRCQEIAIRMALGARPQEVLRMTLAMGSRLVSAGLALGMTGVLLVVRQLDGRGPKLDSLAIFAVFALLGVPAFLACYIPARRAARLAPTVPLRHE